MLGFTIINVYRYLLNDGLWLLIILLFIFIFSSFLLGFCTDNPKFEYYKRLGEEIERKRRREKLGLPPEPTTTIEIKIIREKDSDD